MSIFYPFFETLYKRESFCRPQNINNTSHHITSDNEVDFSSKVVRPFAITMKCKSSLVILFLVFGLTIAQSVEDAFDSDLEEAASEQDLAVAESVGAGGGKGGGAAGKAAAAGGAVGGFAKGNVLIHSPSCSLSTRHQVLKEQWVARQERKARLVQRPEQLLLPQAGRKVRA